MLCMSKGDSDGGHGALLQKELETSCKALGFAESPTVIDDPELQHANANAWSPAMIADYISKHCQMKASVDGHENRYHTLVTYDKDGVSGTPQN